MIGYSGARILTVGVVSPFAVGWPKWRDKWLQTATHERLRSPAFPPHEVIDQERRGFELDPKATLGSKGLRNFDRATIMTLIAAQEALGSWQGRDFVDATNVGVSLATAYGSLEGITELNRVSRLEDPRFINPSRFPNTVINSSAGYLSIWEHLEGPNTTVVSGNCGAIDAFGHSMLMLQLYADRFDAILAGGFEAWSEALELGLQRLCPTVAASEGVALLLLERANPEHRVVTTQSNPVPSQDSLGTLLGYGSSAGVWPRSPRLVGLEASAVSESIREALESGGLRAEDVDILVRGSCGIPWFDDAEERGIQAIFGKRLSRETTRTQPLEVIEPKRILGETFGASGALALAAVLAFATERPRHAIVSLPGFYGNASALALRIEPTTLDLPLI